MKMLDEICKMSLIVSITLLILSLIVMPIVEKNSGQYFVVALSIILNLIFSIFIVLSLYIVKRKARKGEESCNKKL